jgi:LuxR family maltose regulon positive regulatory protein
MVASSILKTKLYIPPARPGLVARLRLIERLNAGQNGKLTLISAPAGFGKTTLLSEWMASSPRSFAWLSLDEGDNDPARFLTYFITALQIISPNTGSGLLASLQSAKISLTRSPSESLLTTLINDMLEIPAAFTMILDDYHTITEKSIQAILNFILEHQPAQMHLVISGRVDPPWPLARLRAQGEIQELRSADLRFTPAEAALFLNESMGLHLTSEAIETLEECTEGWIAGLQMAALSMQGRSDMTGFIEAFSGTHRFIADFLLEEVLARQTPPTQEFMLKTSILDRICAPLADALMEESDQTGADETRSRTSSQAMLTFLEHSNLFLIPMDAEQRWYRYHHLFRDLLRSSLESFQPGQAPLLHRKASQWFAGAGLFDEAIQHAFATRDTTWTAGLIEQAAAQIDPQNKLVVISSWIERLPQKSVEERPWLCVYRAWGQYWTGQREQVAQTLAAAERALAGEAGLHLSEEAVSHINGHIAAIRAHAALTGEDIPRVLEMGEKALLLLPKGDEFRSETGIALGGAYWALGDVVKAERAFAAARAGALQLGYPSMAVPATCYLGMQQTKQARLDEAIATYQDGLRMATGADGKESPVAGFPNTRLGDLLRERNDLELAKSHLLRGVEQCVQLGQADVLTDGYTCLARLQIALGDRPGARENLNRAQTLVQKTKVDPFVLCWLDDCRIQLWLAEGNLDDAAEWMETCGLQPDGELSYHYDLHHLNLARVLVALGRLHPGQRYLEQALGLLERLQEAAANAGWTHEVIKSLALQAAALQISGSQECARLKLLKALRLAEPGGYVRTFLDEGEPMRTLLAEGLAQIENNPRLAAYASRLLSAFAPPRSGDYPAPLRSGDYPGAASAAVYAAKGIESPPAAALVEPLTGRELEVLRLLCAGLTSGEIAVELYLSVHTVRTHIKNIYGKLGANRRLEAAQRAAELKLI